MSKEALLLVLSVALFAIVLCASPLEGRKAIGLSDISRSTRDTAQASSRGEATRKARGSLDSAGLPRCAVLNKRMFSIPESVYSKI